MKMDRAPVLLLAGALLASSSAALADEPLRAADALPATQSVATSHLPQRALKTAGRKEHLQGEADAGAAGSGAGAAVYAGLVLVGVGVAVGTGVSNEPNLHPQSP